MAIVSRDNFLSAYKTTQVEVESLGTVHLRELSAAMAMKVQTVNQDDQGVWFDLCADLLIACVLDAQGEPLLTDEDKPQLLQLSPRLLTEVAQHIFDLSGLSTEGQEDAKKNSETPPGAPSTGSPGASDAAFPNSSTSSAPVN